MSDAGNTRDKREGIMGNVRVVCDRCKTAVSAPAGAPEEYRMIHSGITDLEMFVETIRSLPPEDGLVHTHTVVGVMCNERRFGEFDRLVLRAIRDELSVDVLMAMYLSTSHIKSSKFRNRGLLEGEITSRLYKELDAEEAEKVIASAMW